MLAELVLLSSAQPHPAYASTCSAVQPMLTLEHFEAALERARQHNRLVVIKFYQATTAPDHRPRPPPQTTAPPLRLGPHIRTRLRAGPPP